MASLTVNGRKREFPHLTNFRRGQYTYEYLVTRGETVYCIWGGKASGGRRNEWYVESVEWNGPIQTSGLMDSLKMLDGM